MTEETTAMQPNPELLVKDEITKELKKYQATDSEIDEILKRLLYKKW